ncbi:MAG: hypothetical protein ACK58Z_22140, partial [Pseudanabaena sp.]
MNQLNQHFKRSLCCLMCLLGISLLDVQETKAKDTLDQSLQSRYLQAQTSSTDQSFGQTVKLNSATVNSDGLSLKDGDLQTNVAFSTNANRNILGLLINEVADSNITKHSSVASLPIDIPTTIDGLSFNGYGQLVIQASRAITYRSRLDLANNIYSVTVPATRISSQLRRPILGANSPIEQIRLNQVGDSVVISIKTIAGWQIKETPRTDAQAIALQLVSVV